LNPEGWLTVGIFLRPIIGYGHLVTEFGRG
jgi:hypothetical protein